MRLPVGQRSFCRRAGWLAESGDPTHEQKLRGVRTNPVVANARRAEDGGPGPGANDGESN